MNRGRRQSALYAVPERNVPVEVHNPCLDENTDAIQGCDRMWAATAVIPREYLPPNVNKYVRVLTKCSLELSLIKVLPIKHIL